MLHDYFLIERDRGTMLNQGFYTSSVLPHPPPHWFVTERDVIIRGQTAVVMVSQSSCLANTPPYYIFCTCWEETSSILYWLRPICPEQLLQFAHNCCFLKRRFSHALNSTLATDLGSSFIPLLFCTLMRRLSLGVPSVSAARSRCEGWLAVSGRVGRLEGQGSSPSGSRPRTGSHSAVTVGGSIVGLLAAGRSGRAPATPPGPHQRALVCVNFTQRLMYDEFIKYRLEIKLYFNRACCLLYI